MRQFMIIAEKVLDTSLIYGEAEHALSQQLSPKMGYVVATREIRKTLQAIADKHAIDTHPITVLIDVFDFDGAQGSLQAHDGGAWININLDNIVSGSGSWQYSTDQATFEKAMMSAASSFANQMMQYDRFLANWNHHETAPQDRKVRFEDAAADAARELLKVYGTSTIIREALKKNVKDVMIQSPSMRAYMTGRGREEMKKFLRALYREIGA